MGIHELLVGSDEVKRLVQKRSTVEDLRRQAVAEGMTTLLQDGIQKVLQGHTDFKQVRAVCLKLGELWPTGWGAVPRQWRVRWPVASSC